MEGFVVIEKLERLEQFDIGEKKLKEMVLTDVDPFPGYYSETPGSDSNKPKMVFVAMKQEGGMYEDLILRAGMSVKEKVDYKFEVNYGRFLLFNKMKPCVRIKINDFDNVPDMLEKLKEEGIQFESSQKVSAYDSNIKVRKYLTFNEVSKGIYSGIDLDHYYIKVPKHLKWNDFVELIFSIRRSGDFGVFDAAQTSLYLKDDIAEFVRIFSKTLNENNLEVLKNEILKRI